jgi:uncharacterized protein (DUF362 family)
MKDSTVKSPSFVVISHAKDIDYTRDYVSLPKEYGTPAYEAREDVRAIREVVHDNLRQLDEKVHFTDRLKGRHVLLKPNLVCVFHNLGTVMKDSPESTDPRVIDAVIEFVQRYTKHITIVESSGRGMPTRASFKIAGLDRLARHRGVELIALEEQPTDRYLLPKAKVMKEIVVPRIFSEVVRGEAFYISIPKMKTNLYTGVTLGFKNAMGTITYNLRQRNHNHAIDQKLVDMLHLFKADLVVIDGIVGGAGDCPAPVRPVASRVIVSGNQSVETDRVATRMMGFNPDEIALMRAADIAGFCDPDVTVLGEEKVFHFEPAEASLTGKWMKENFPNVRVLVGHTKNGAPQAQDHQFLNLEQMRALEYSCRGGCLASTRYAFAMFLHEGQKRDFKATLIIGNGVRNDGQVYYYDANGKPYTVEDIKAIKGKKLVIGTCAAPLKNIATRYIDGCMPFPNSQHASLHLLTGTLCGVMSPRRNRYLVPALIATLAVCEKRKSYYRQGIRLDIPLGNEDKIYIPRPLSAEEAQLDAIYEPCEPLSWDDIRRLCAMENRAILATFIP